MMAIASRSLTDDAGLKSIHAGGAVNLPSKQRDFVRQAVEIPETSLDATDRRIVAELQAAPRLRRTPE